MSLDDYKEFLLNLDITLDITNVNKPKENKPKPEDKEEKIEFDHINPNKKNYEDEEDNHIDSSALKIQENNNKNDIIKINIVISNIERNRESTYSKKIIKIINPKYLRQTTKKTKVPYGKWIKYYYDNNKNHQEKEANIKNIFIKNHPQICKDILTYFMDDVPKFLSLRAIELKTAIVDCGQKKINESIIADEKFLYYISYHKFCEPLQKSFSDENYKLNLEKLFIKFQENNKGKFKNNNKKVIKYIRANQLKEKDANEFLDLTFYGLCDYFSKNFLNEYLDQRRIELIHAYETSLPFEEYIIIIEAFHNIIETLSKNFREYTISKIGRIITKPRIGKKFSIRRPEKNKKSKK